MNRKTLQFGAILCLVAMLSFAAWPMWRWLRVRPASARLYERTKAATDKDPRLHAAWVIALQDDVLTPEEARVILEAGGEKVEPGE